MTSLAAAVALIAAMASPAAADFTIALPAGLACPGFALGIASAGETAAKEFRDRDGNVVRTIRAGKGATLTLTNLDSGASLRLKANGSAQKTTFNADGTASVQSTGHNVIILFPTDDPPGPSTVLYVGRVTYTVDQAGNFTGLASAGTSRDICAELG